MFKFDSPFFNNLTMSRKRHVIICGDTEDFAPDIVEQWQSVGFTTRYLWFEDDGDEALEALKQLDNDIPLGETYALVAFGDAAACVLQAFVKPKSTRLVAVAAYYPPAIPLPTTKYPASLKVVVHLAGDEIDVKRYPQMLGIQSNKLKTVRKQIEPGAGYGGCLRLGFKTYSYIECEPGFAEHDLDEYDQVAEDVAFSRSLAVLSRAFQVDEEIELIRDDMVDAAMEDNAEKLMKHISDDSFIINTPSLTGGIGTEDIEAYYSDTFYPLPPSFIAKLLSRTIGSDRIVDEVFLNFKHSEPVPWLLPGVPATNRSIEIIIVSIVCIRGGILQKEHTYWDQASVLMQAGLLDASAVSAYWKKKGVKRLPIVGAEGSRAVEREDSNKLNSMLS